MTSNGGIAMYEVVDENGNVGRIPEGWIVDMADIFQ